MLNCATTQKTLTKLEFYSNIITYTIYNIYNAMQVTIQYTILNRSLHVGTIGDLYWIYYLINLAWLINFIQSIRPNQNEENSVPMWRDCLPSFPLLYCSTPSFPLTLVQFSYYFWRVLTRYFSITLFYFNTAFRQFILYWSVRFKIFHDEHKI